MRQSTLTFLTLIFMSSCFNEKAYNEVEEIAQTNFDTTSIVSENNLYIEDTIQYDTITFPNFEKLKTKILLEGNYHNDEVWSSAKKEKWLGLFYNSNEIYIDTTKLIIKNVNDAVLDDEKEKSGWEVQAKHKDTSILFIQSEFVLPKRNIIAVKIKKNQLYPNDSFEFTYLGKKYTLYAKGGKRKADFNSNEDYIYNYKLFLKTEEKESLLRAVENFSDQMIDILFIGDIDGDEIPDILIDSSRHYNTSCPTLFLSKPAEKNEIVKPVGFHESVGC